MSCVLRIFGADLDIDALLPRLSFAPIVVFRRGEPVAGRGGPVRRVCGANFSVSDADLGDLARQIADARQFLQTHHLALEAIRAFAGVDAPTLDFAVAAGAKPIARSATFPADMLQTMGALGLALEISTYTISDD